MMRLPLLFLFVCLFIPFTKAQWEHEFGSWSSVQVSHNTPHRWLLGGRIEHRRRDALKELDLGFARAMVGRSITSWLSFELAADHMWRTSNNQNRMLLSLSAKGGWGPVRWTLRQRYIYAHNCALESHNDLMRTMLMISYPIPHSRITPYAMGEGYYWDDWQMTHLFGGCKWAVDNRSTIDIFCVCNLKSSTHTAIYSIGIGYNLAI